MSDDNPRDITISLHGTTLDATISCSPTNRAPGQQPDWTLTLTCGDLSWTGAGPDVFEALRQLMRVAAADGALIGVTGARPNAWSSGMQRDMGCGYSTYLLSTPQPPGRPPDVPTLSPVDPSLVGTVEEQDAFHKIWLENRGAPGS